MRSTNVILLFALLAISFANSFEFNSLAEVQELKSSTYGNSLIQTISLSLQSNGNIADVQKLLDDLLFKLNQDQIHSDKEWEKTNKTLSNKIAELKTQIEQLRVKIAGIEKDIADYSAKIVKGNKNLVQYKSQVVHNSQQLASMKVHRKKDSDSFKTSQQEHNDILNAIELVIKELSKLTGSVSGKGRPVHVEKIEAEKRDDAYAATLMDSFAQITKDEAEAVMFTQLATTADQAALKKLIGLLKQLSESVKKSLNDEVEHEAQSKKIYQSLKTTLTEDNKKLNALITTQTQHVKDYTEKVAKLNIELTNNKKLKASKEAELVATVKLRQDKENQYNSDKAERNKEREIVQKLINIVKQRLSNMSKFLRSSTSS